MKILLGSRSPRRQDLLSRMELEYELVSIDCDEDFEGVDANAVAEYLAVKKSKAFGRMENGQLLITADTTVVLGDVVLNKAETEEEARVMLEALSGKTHKVISGVCLRTAERSVSFNEVTEVDFESLTDQEIEHYIQEYEPFDKAGSYGIQEWIGICKIKSIKGCYYNVMGLPCARLYSELQNIL